MTSFEGWIPSIPPTLSFEDHFKIQLDTPEDRTLSRSTKPTSQEEQSSTGPSLHRLATFDVQDLHLSIPDHNFTWAENVLAEYAPLDPRGWDVRSIESRNSGWLDSEDNVLSFLDSAYLGRALCAGWFLCCHSLNHQPSPCPVTRHLAWHDTSSYSSSGRPDRTLFFRGQQATLVEGKTEKVCSSVDANTNSVHVLHELHRFATTHPGGPVVSTWPQRSGTWETKARKFVLQVCSHMHMNLMFLLNHPPDLAPATH
jgi:hypothetical protein